MECPCEKCLVRAACRSRVVKMNRGKECLVIELLEKCPLIVNHFKKSKYLHHANHAYSDIFAVCKCMNVKDNYFIWYRGGVN